MAAQKKEETKAEAKESYKVAKGSCITSKIGMLTEGQGVEASYLSGGEDSIKNLLDKKIIVKA